mgnify:CR=1 FL=1
MVVTWYLFLFFANGLFSRPNLIATSAMLMGAGAVGCYIGGCLAAAGVPVTFVGRPRVLQALAGHGLTLTDLDGARRVVPAAQLSLSEAVPAGFCAA